MKTIGELLKKGKRTVCSKSTKTKSLVSTDEFVGIELEVEDAGRLNGTLNNNANCDQYWNVKGDDSLRFSGIELCSLPLYGINIVRAIRLYAESVKEDMLYAAEQGKDRSYLSDRTSMHVHLNVTDITTEQLQTIIYLYVIFEKLFFKAAGGYFMESSRDNNNYCVPLTHAEPAIVQKSYGNVITNSGAYLNNLCDYAFKYSALNIKPMKTFGTIEFRQHPGATQAQDVLNWVNLILSLKKFAKEFEGTPEDLMKMANEDRIALYKAVIKHVKLRRMFKKLYKVGQLGNDLEYGIRYFNQMINFRKHRLIVRSKLKELNENDDAEDTATTDVFAPWMTQLGGGVVPTPQNFAVSANGAVTVGSNESQEEGDPF